LFPVEFDDEAVQVPLASVYVLPQAKQFVKFEHDVHAPTGDAVPPHNEITYPGK